MINAIYSNFILKPHQRDDLPDQAQCTTIVVSSFGPLPAQLVVPVSQYKYKIMFANAYQNGPCLEVWDAKVDPSKNHFYQQLATTNIPHPRAFDKQAKSYLLTLQSQNSKMSLPANESKPLSLHQPYLVLQIFVPIGFPWWIELAISNIQGHRKRINLTTVAGKPETKYFSYRQPIEVTKGTWLFLGIHMYSFMQAFKGQTYRALDHITVGSTCKLRRIFTMKDFVDYEIPKGFWLTRELPQSLELISFDQQVQKKAPLADLMKESRFRQPSQPNALVNRSKKRENRSEMSPPAIQTSKVNRSRDRSQVIIQKAKERLHSLEKEQELLLQQSQDLTNSLYLNNRLSKKPQAETIEQPHPKSRIVKNASSQHSSKSPKVKAKFPPLQRSFKEDEALNSIEERTWVQTERQVKVGGGMSMFPSTVITRQNESEVQMYTKRKQLQLIYDEMVGCYYHPETNSYFQLKP